MMRLISMFIALLLFVKTLLTSIFNPAWWLSKKLNPYSSYTRFPDRYSAFLFRLDIVLLNLLGKAPNFIRNMWIRRLEITFPQEDKGERKILALEEFDHRHQDWNELAEHLNKYQRPIKIPGFLEDDPLYEEWNLDTLIEKYGEEEQTIFSPDRGGFYYGPFKDVNQPGYYVSTSEYLFSKHPNLMRQMGISRLAKLMGRRFIHLGIAQLFAGRKKTGSVWHCAYPFNTFLMLSGKKKWWFIDPEDSPLMIPVGTGQALPLYFNASNIEMVQHIKSDDHRPMYDAAIKLNQPLCKENFAKFAHAMTQYETTLNPGDLLINMPFWWHEIENLTSETIGVALRWELRFPRPSPNRLFRDCMLLNIKRTADYIDSAFKYKLFDRKGNLKTDNVPDNVVDDHREIVRIASNNPTYYDRGKLDRDQETIYDNNVI